MSGKYEVYLTDDAGIRIQLLKDFAFISVSRSIIGYGTLHIGIPFEAYTIRPIFLPDRRIEVWRSPRHGATMRREGTFFLRKWNVYARETDSVQIIEFWGRSPIDILRRQPVTSSDPAKYKKIDFIDDMMKEIVNENFISPQQTAPAGELTVDGNESLGPSISHAFQGQNVLDVLKDLRDISISLNEAADTYNRIYFDVVEGDPLPTGGFGFTFRTFSNLRGTDRTGGTIFSMDNGNIEAPSYFEDHLDSVTMATVHSQTNSVLDGSAETRDRYLSRWNDIRVGQQSSESSKSINDARANQMLREGKSDKALNVTFLDSPGSSSQPRSLYGLDWDLGDLLPVNYADLDFNAEVTVVYVSLDEQGEENIVGMCRLRPSIEVSNLYEADYLLVGGGGGGGGGVGGGGGGGEVISGEHILTPGFLYTITIGAGGSGGVAATAGVAGNNSLFDTVDVALGGGYGGGISTGAGLGGNGAAGGGGGRTGLGGTATGSGKNGGDGFSDFSAGGGGGHGTVGATGDAITAGVGGNGTASAITGTLLSYGGGGGGGGSNLGATGGAGGTGGGGAGQRTGPGTAGTANTGGGGGGGGQVGGVSNETGGLGGSGVVIIRLLSTIYTGTVTGAPTVTIDGDYTVVKFTASGTYTA